MRSWNKVAVDSEMRLVYMEQALEGAGEEQALEGTDEEQAPGGHLRGTDTGEYSRGVELANLGISRDRGLDGTSRDGKRLDGTSGCEGDPGVRMGATNSNGSAMSCSADFRGRSGSADSRGRSCSADSRGRSCSAGSQGSSGSAELDGTGARTVSWT